MSDETLERAVHWVKKVGINDVLALHVFGEPLLHPRFVEFAKRFVEHCPITMSTNGILLDYEMAKKLAQIPWAWISVSPWDEAAKQNALVHLSSVGICTMEPQGAIHDWAGQASGPKATHSTSCPFLNHGRAVIRWDGSVASCCISDRLEDAVGHVRTEPEQVSLKAYSICEGCHLNGG
jgi:hypothetical protein